VLHGALLLLLMLSPRLERKVDDRPAAAQERRQVSMMYLPPEPAVQLKSHPRVKPPPPPAPRRTPPPRPTPAFAQAVPRPLPEIPSPAKERVPDLPDHDDPAAMSPHPVSRPDRPEQSPASGDRATRETAAAQPEDAMVTEARRLFGPPPATNANVAGPVRTGLPLPFMNGGSRCAWSGEEAKAVERPANGVIEGIVRTESSGRPIPGAFLQMLGTGSATFADETGHYRLTFDPSLVDVCRSQLVRVTAPGYRARTMILTLGPPSDNIVDLSGRP